MLHWALNCDFHLPHSLRDSGVSIAAGDEVGLGLKGAVYILIDWINA